MRWRILLVTENPERAALLEGAVTTAGHAATGWVQPVDDLGLSVVRTQPDALVAWIEAMNDSARRQFAHLSQASPLPMVLFADRADGEDIRLAVKAGISSVVVDGFRADRVAAVLEVAVARFAELETLRARCSQAEIRMVEHKSIERAKGIIMRRRNVPEEAAFEVLRQMARKRRKRLPEVADNVIAAEEMLAKG